MKENNFSHFSFLSRFDTLFLINVVFLATYILLSSLSFLFPTSSLLQFLQSVVILFICFILFGLNAVCILEKTFRQHFDVVEKIVVAAALTLFLPPLILTLESSILKTLFSSFPLLNTLITFLIATAYCPKSMEGFFSELKREKKSFSLPFGFSLIILSLLALAVVSAYPFLPESDPYYWMLTAEQAIHTQSLPSLTEYRPLFSSLAYIFSTTGNIDLYTFFKYLLPFLSLLILFPALLIVRRLKSLSQQVITFLLPLASASTILYFFLPIPQALISICLTFFVFFLLYSLYSGRNFFYFFAGSFIFLTYFYHEIASLFFLPWLLVTMFYYRHDLLRKIHENKLVTVLLFLLTFSHSSILLTIVDFFKNWFVRITDSLHIIHTNFTFPITYTNIDGKAAGWGNFLGVSKYYLFYVGPLVLLIIGILLYVVLTPGYRQSFLQTCKKKKEVTILLIIFTIFFSIAEIFPRLLGLALLPERAWGFIGFILIALIPFLWLKTNRHETTLSLLLVGALLLNSGAALYINFLKRDTIPPAQYASLLWIRNHLPTERILMVQNNWSTIRTYSRSKVIEVPDQIFYTNISSFKEAMGEAPALPPLNDIEDHYKAYLLSSTEILNTLKKEDVSTERAYVARVLRNLSTQSYDLASQLEERQIKRSYNVSEKHIYIYYAAPAHNSLYADRPYYKENETAEPTTFVFDQYPEQFKKIYNDQENKIFIWEFNQGTL